MFYGGHIRYRESEHYFYHTFICVYICKYGSRAVSLRVGVQLPTDLYVFIS